MITWVAEILLSVFDSRKFTNIIQPQIPFTGHDNHGVVLKNREICNRVINRLRLHHIAVDVENENARTPCKDQKRMKIFTQRPSLESTTHSAVPVEKSETKLQDVRACMHV